MKNSRKIIAGLLVAAGLATAGAIAYANPEGYGPGWGGHHHGMGGPGMMGGGWGQGGFGPGVMGGHRGGAMGTGMMGGYGVGPGFDVNLTEEQRGKIAKIRDDVRRKQSDLMGKMHDEQSQMNAQFYSDKRDDAALSKSFGKMSDLRQQMFDLSLSAQKQTDAVLTKEQRDKLKRGGHGMRGY